jgi:hypothetical protein
VRLSWRGLHPLQRRAHARLELRDRFRARRRFVAGRQRPRPPLDDRLALKLPEQPLAPRGIELDRHAQRPRDRLGGLGGAGEVGADQSTNPRHLDLQPRRQHRRLSVAELIERNRQVALHDAGGVGVGLAVSEQQ